MRRGLAPPSGAALAVWFPGASAGVPGCFGKHAVSALPSVGSSVSVLLSGNNGCADEVDSSRSFV